MAQRGSRSDGALPPIRHLYAHQDGVRIERRAGAARVGDALTARGLTQTTVPVGTPVWCGGCGSELRCRGPRDGP